MLFLLSTQGNEVLSKYVAQYAAHLIKENNTMKALELFVKYGAPPISQVGYFIKT